MSEYISRWVPFHSEVAGDIQYCEVCGIGFDAKTYYCPHCGARMFFELNDDAFIVPEWTRRINND